MEEPKLTSMETITLLILKEIRLERQMHQAEVAERCGKTASAWSKIENGENSLSLYLFFQVCYALNVAPWIVINTTEHYASMMSNYHTMMSNYHTNKWCILLGNLENNSNDLLKLSSKYYSSPLFKNKLYTSNLVNHLFTLNIPIYNGYYDYTRMIDVFRYALDPTFRDPSPSDSNSSLC
ncbi:helix-turn-helix transcriptional regulator [Commensalibacter sp. W8133]|uniref:helix-turn-helix domain-containing protein n=1 Tax=Commensalibacter sp. W8133 TaxID=2750953 RepID=UPI0018DD306F|nr:helix-turn-helix transcriptional regulator [Commensalibacter sp. W8133]MBI0018139.1 helix-turn-helix transcriptional regulator [Commensalibacter sp. W8133]